MRVDDVALPRREDDGPLMLAARSHLREEVGPELGAGVDGHSPWNAVSAHPRMDERQREDHGGGTLGDDARVSTVERYPKLEAPPGAGEVAVPEIHPEQVRIGIIVGRAEHEHMFPDAPDGMTDDRR